MEGQTRMPFGYQRTGFRPAKSFLQTGGRFNSIANWPNGTHADSESGLPASCRHWRITLAFEMLHITISLAL
jgi:hypothetical protein